MSTIVVMPGGFHPFHAGHLALYQSAQRAFPDAEVFVAATNDTSARPFPFAIKEKLARLAGVEPGHFVQVKSPFRAEEITSQFNPESDVLIFVRSEKDSAKPPQAGGVKKDGSPAYLQPLIGAKRLEPFARHAYMAYLPTVEFGPGMTSATEIRTAWPELNEKRKTALVMSLYPATQKNPALAANVVKMLDTAMVAESINPMTANTAGSGAGMTATWQERYNQPAMENQGWAATYEDSDDYIEEKWSQKYKRSINCANPRGFSQRAHCAGRKKNEGVAEGFPHDVDHMPGPVIRNADMTTDNVKTRDKAEWDRATDSINARVFDDMSEFRTDSKGETVVGDSAVWAKWDNATQTGWFNAKGRPLKPWPVKEQGVAEDQLAEKCWDTHRQEGMKKKGNRMVPNCVPKESQ